MQLRVIGVAGLPEVRPGDDVGAAVAAAAREQATAVQPGDVVVIAQKIVSKAEGRLVAADTGERVREVALKESRRVLRETPEHLIAQTRHGFVCANAGVDSSNAPEGQVVLLPKDPDASAQRIRRTLETEAGGHVAVIVADTFGRPWRLGHTNVAIGCSGIAPIRDHRGQVDPAGRELVVTEIAHVDELAGAAELVMGKLDRVPVAIVRGYAYERSEAGAATLVRPAEQDLFR